MNSRWERFLKPISVSSNVLKRKFSTCNLVGKENTYSNVGVRHTEETQFGKYAPLQLLGNKIFHSAILAD